MNGLPVLPITLAPALKAARSERDVGGDYDVALGRALGDPVVGRIGAVGDDHALDQRLSGRRIQVLETKQTSMPWRSATRTASSFTGRVGIDVEVHARFAFNG